MRRSAQAIPQLEAGTGLAKLIFDLGDLLERHIRKEERELFPLFEQHVEGAKGRNRRGGDQKDFAIGIHVRAEVLV